MELHDLRAFCLSLPGVTEDVKWEHDLCFCIGEKMFCVTSFDKPVAFSFKAGDELFAELSNREGFSPAPYLARHKWIRVSDASLCDASAIREWVKNSYKLVLEKLPAKVRKSVSA